MARISNIVPVGSEKNATCDPFVGIFWLYAHRLVFTHAVPLADGLRYGDAVTGRKDHADYWEELLLQVKLNILPMELREEYFSIPRGRVVFHTDTQNFYVYHGNNTTKAALRKVATAFHLPKEKTVFEQDTHYCDFSDEEWSAL